MTTASKVPHTSREKLVVSILAEAGRALSAPEILELAASRRPMNKVTVYRILDRLVEAGIAGRHSAGDRTMRYCLAPCAGEHGHGHFYCTGCGLMECLDLDAMPIDRAALETALSRRVDHLELRLDGLCEACRKR